jgi:hypothetical protein
MIKYTLMSPPSSNNNTSGAIPRTHIDTNNSEVLLRERELYVAIRLGDSRLLEGLRDGGRSTEVCLQGRSV